MELDQDLKQAVNWCSIPKFPFKLKGILKGFIINKGSIIGFYIRSLNNYLNIILGVPYHNYSTMGPKTLF